MAYPTINYNSDTGNDTNPTDAIASSVTESQTASGTASGTTITFSSSVDLSGVEDDDSDYIWVNTSSGERHLFQITAFTFTESLAACTAVTVAETIESTFSGAAWHVNGTRNDIDADNSNGDYMDWGRGWTAVLDGSWTLGNAFRPGGNLSSSNNTVSDPPITIKASSSATTIPTITGPSWARMLHVADYLMVKVEGIKLTQTAGGSLCFVAVDTGALTMVNCEVVNTSSTQPTNLFEAVASNRALRLFDCYIKGGGTRCIRSAFNSHLLIDNCVFDCVDTYGSECAVLMEGEDNVITSSLILESAGAGIRFEVDGTAGQQGFWMVKNCTIVDCAGDGIELTGTPTATTQPTHTFAILNTLAVNNGGYGFDLPETNVNVHTGNIDYNCVFNNTSGGYNGATAGPE